MNGKISINFVLIGTLLLLVCWCIVKLSKMDLETLEMQLSLLSGKSYGIQEMLPNANKSADIIARLDLFINKFISYLDSKYPNDKKVKRLINRTIDTRIEESPYENGTSSFTINKGESISLCIRHKNKNKDFHNYQTLLFVVIHELAHVASITKGHNNEFIKNFKWLLQEANDSGMYSPVNYSQNPITYCGVKVTNNPIM